MRKVLFIFGQLTDTDIEWLAKAGRRKKLPANTVLIHKGGRVETLFILLEGELVVEGAQGRQIARLGVGEIVGEMSFIEARPPSATVRAATDVVVYAVPRQVLERGLADNDAFAARFYKAVATFLSDRVRMATAGEQGLDRDNADELDDAVLDNVDRAGARFDALGRLLLDG
ncbi:MAG TPA: cyclic nucleotide-binding domain-containing protein [Polyangiaceae bacterium]|jgi:CRP-like cAMP-binding protein|nr:cyclic nucleotide-binding domain-containing protein [Polyangiaceae bacterium]